MNSISPKPRPTLWRVIWLGSLLMLIIEVGSVVLGATIGALGGFFALLLGCFLVAGFCAKFINDWAGIVVACAFPVFSFVLFGNAAQPLWLSVVGERSLGYPIVVADAPEYKASFYEFKDGQIRTDLIGYYSTSGYRSSKGSSGHPSRTEYIVAPLVGADWTPADEVPVWVVCNDTWDTDGSETSDTDNCRKKWLNGYRSGFSIEPGNVGDASEAVADAVAEHGLRSHPSAKYIYWSANAREETAVQISISLIIAGLMHLTYIISALVKRNNL